MDSTSELAFFALLAKAESLASAARELGLTPPAVSKRLAQMEARLGVRLMNRTTRRIGLTDEGAAYLESARRILADIDEMEQRVSSRRAVPRGLLRVSATYGFGRHYIAPLISDFCLRYPEVEVQLQLGERPPPLSEEAFDVGIHFGTPPDARVIARKIRGNRRWICAAPAYVKRCGLPQVPADLAGHNCLLLRQEDGAYGTWRFTRGARTETVKVSGTLSSNDGQVALGWVLQGHGIMMRSEWDAARYVRSGRLVQLLPEYTLPPADIHAIYPARHNLSARVRTFVDFLVEQSGRDESW
ncbi:LysR substrate-binding domain-containing protein [Paludibacterium yongneupense]|uniref:LysR substrate-binding domain-containing protein n=1 Tax=Paludibacterium yongneupense TaxID=400061 RepID=UPI00042299CB|nr:LysR substrate-binding domain-containing protein [Paludibacterium yongneupense]